MMANDIKAQLFLSRSECSGGVGGSNSLKSREMRNLVRKLPC